MKPEKADKKAQNRGGRQSRREFVRSGSLFLAGAALGLSRSAVVFPAEEAKAAEKPARTDTPSIPRRVLGRTGVEVSILGLGTACLGHQNDNNPEISKLIDVYGEAIDRGINYVDTGRIYGRAEEALQAVLKTRRDKVFLVTKAWANTLEEAEKSFNESMKKLGVDHVDVLHLHSTGDKDIDKVLGKGGSWEFMEKAKSDGRARFLGITGHSRPANFLRLLETGKVDVMMVAMNFVDRHIYGFEEKVLPAARKQKTGVMAMKVFGGIKGGFKNYPSRTPFPAQMPEEFHKRSMAYVKALEGVTGMVIGVHSREQLLENIKNAVETKPLSREEFDKLCEEGKTLASGWRDRFGPVT